MTDPMPCQNNDKELWRETPGDYYAPSIHVTEHGGIGINVGGSVYVKSVREWHKLASRPSPAPTSEGVREALEWAEDLKPWVSPKAAAIVLAAEVRRLSTAIEVKDKALRLALDAFEQNHAIDWNELERALDAASGKGEGGK